ncbi:MAG: hypothetical protein R3C01_09295 [Planctomycetaceae bacterium]
MPPSDASDADPSAWLKAGRGITPEVNWQFVTEGELTALELCAETGEVIVADNSGVLCQLDRRGQIASLTRLNEPVRQLAWSANGELGSCICGERTLHVFGRGLKSLWKLTLPEVVLTVAVAPYGTHLVVTLADGINMIYDAGKNRLCKFETVRPLSFVSFMSESPGFVAAAEHGLLCRHLISGQNEWHQKLWSNVGQLSITGDGATIYTASFAHGIQAFDQSGKNTGSYILDGTVHRVHGTFEPNRILAATVEQSLYWLDADGELMWATKTPESVTSLRCDPLGESALVGLASGRLLSLTWSGRLKGPKSKADG